MMDIQTRKIEFVQEFLKLENEELISHLEALLRSNKSDNDFRPITITDLNSRINKSIEYTENNRLTTSGELIAEIEKWD